MSALHAVPDDDLGMPSDDDGVATTTGVTTTASVTTITTATSATTATSLPHPNHSLMNVDGTATDSGNKQHLSITSLSNKSRVNPVPASSTVVSNSSGLGPKKVAKSVIGSTSYSTPSQTSKAPSHISKSASQSASTSSTQKAAKLSQAVTFTKLKHLMTGLLDTICVIPEDSVAKSHHEITAFIHKDDYLLSAQKMHCIKLFINNVAYTVIVSLAHIQVR